MKAVATIILFLTISLAVVVCADYPNHPAKTSADCMGDLNPYSVFATALPDATDFITSHLVDKKWTHRAAPPREGKKTLRRPAFLRAVFARPVAVNPNNLQSS